VSQGDAETSQASRHGQPALYTMSTTRASAGRVLSFPPVAQGPTVPEPFIATERRLKPRYPLNLSVRFRGLFRSGEFRLSSLGRTMNMSAGGLLVASQEEFLDDDISTGSRVEISIEWPALLDGSIPLQLVAICRVIRRGPLDFATAFERHEFRTMKKLQP
jgi:hypothetical protein